jgi:hypothetical protein
MNAQLEDVSPHWYLRLISEFNAADERAKAVASALTAEQLNWKPDPGKWSIGQCLEHLYITNEVYCQSISKSLAGHPVSVVEEIRPGWFGRWFIRNYIEPSARTKRARAPRKIKPGANIDASILDRFLDSNRRARELVHRARPYDVNRIRFENPFVGVIRFTVGTGFEILSKHEQRHLLQAERVRQSLKLPVRD